MVICPNCQHENPDGATFCETCYTPLAVAVDIEDDSDCPSCGAKMPPNATFCGQCGFNLTQSSQSQETADLQKQVATVVELSEPLEISEQEEQEQQLEEVLSDHSPDQELQSLLPENSPETRAINSQTQLQIATASLLHIQTDQTIDLPTDLAVIHLGKPNEHIPPDIDVSGFPHSQIVSRIHADIREEAGTFYIEDTGSANGTYINHIPLPRGNRHKLRTGDRIALGKEDKVSFIFQLKDE